MLDGVTLDQLRTFIDAAEQGSFSAASRKLRRAQSVVSQTLAKSKGQNYGVFSKHAWPLADMGAKHAFLRAGFGFGNMPRFMVEDDIASKKLRIVRIELPSNVKPLMPMR